MNETPFDAYGNFRYSIPRIDYCARIVQHEDYATAVVSTHRYRYAAGFGDAVSVKVLHHVGASDGPVWTSAYEYNYHGTPHYPVPAIPLTVQWWPDYSPNSSITIEANDEIVALYGE